MTIYQYLHDEMTRNDEENYYNTKKIEMQMHEFEREYVKFVLILIYLSLN
jgi:hypothetical protein